jgi:hypothetical protein
VPVIGVGAWAWGDRSGYWGYGQEYGKEESRAAYKVRRPLRARMRSSPSRADRQPPAPGNRRCRPPGAGSAAPLADRTAPLTGSWQAILREGLSFIDTAEVYGFGLSESFLGEFMKEDGTSPIIATKFAPQVLLQRARRSTLDAAAQP